MSRFAKEITDDEIMSQPATQIPWFTIVEIMTKSKSYEFTNEKIMSQPVTQIPWGTLITVILAKSKSHEESIWYINETYKNGWSRNMVLNQITMKSYERSLIEPDTTIKIKSDESLNDIFKDT